MTRGDRLEAERKKKAKMKRALKETWHDPSLADDPKRIGMMAHTPHGCSCRMCGNPRKHEKGKDRLTIQERKHID